jgi:hypothetical protein
MSQVQADSADPTTRAARTDPADPATKADPAVVVGAGSDSAVAAVETAGFSAEEEEGVAVELAEASLAAVVAEDFFANK